jgi:hypothetical protein
MSAIWYSGTVVFHSAMRYQLSTASRTASMIYTEVETTSGAPGIGL